MGLFDFFHRDAGKKVGTEDAPKPEDLKQEVARLGFEVKDLDIQVSGDTVTVRGTAASQEQREKILLALGNVHGIAKVDDQLSVAETPAAAPEPSQFYTVKSGDTLSKIAKEFYQNANKYQTIFEANRPMLKDPDEIYPGQVLRIPKAA
jgi:nucleoid-associated protein YgaU